MPETTIQVMYILCCFKFWTSHFSNSCVVPQTQHQKSSSSKIPYHHQTWNQKWVECHWHLCLLQLPLLSKHPPTPKKCISCCMYFSWGLGSLGARVRFKAKCPPQRELQNSQWFFCCSKPLFLWVRMSPQKCNLLKRASLRILFTRSFLQWLRYDGCI